MKIGAIAGVFVLTLIISGSSFANEEMNKSGDHMGQRIEKRIKKLTDELKLTPEQQSKVREIFKSLHDDISSLMEKTREQMKILREQSRDKINALLDEKQKPKYASIVSKQDKKMAERKKHFMDMHKEKEGDGF